MKNSIFLVVFSFIIFLQAGTGKKNHPSSNVQESPKSKCWNRYGMVLQQRVI